MMKKMYITLTIILAIYLVGGVLAWFRGPIILAAKLQYMYPYYLSPITWIVQYEPSGRTNDGAMKIGYSEQGKYQVNILTGKWEKLNKNNNK